MTFGRSVCNHKQALRGLHASWWQLIFDYQENTERLEENLVELLELAPALTPGDRTTCLDGLHDLWLRRCSDMSVHTQAHMLDLSTEWCDWPLAIAIGEMILERQAPTDATTPLHLIHAHRQLGDAESAFDYAIVSQLAYPRDVRCADSFQDITEWHAWRENWGRIDGDALGDPVLSLEPLGFHHIRDFVWQYHDPVIAERCCLPQFESSEHWRNWLRDIYRAGDEHIHAVIHREWGFIGSVSLILHRGIGFLYYWLGPDFQKRGYGPRAVRLLLTDAVKRYGLHTCYAKVFIDNEPSRKALAKLGFDNIRVYSVAPNDNEMFYRRGPPADRHQIAEELHWLCATMESTTRPAILMRAVC